MSVLKIGIIGAGDAARAAHVPSYAANPKVELVAVADPNLAAAQSLADQYSIPNVFPDYRNLLADNSISTVDICAPHHLHYPIAIDALNAGKHVICEKPIALNLEQADAMIAAAHHAGLKLLITLNQRFLPIHTKVKEFLDTGRLGKVFLANAYITGNVMPEMNNENHWKGSWNESGGGALFDTGTHIIDLMLYWFGKPSAVSAVLKKLVCSAESKADDNASVTLEFDNDMIANVVVSYSVEHEPWSEKKFIYGTGGDVAIISEAALPMFLVKSGIPELVEVEHEAGWWGWSHDRCLQHYVDCILKDTQPTVTAEDARAALKTITAAYESARESRRVELEPD